MMDITWRLALMAMLKCGCGFFGGGDVSVLAWMLQWKKMMIHDGHHFKAGVMVIIGIKWECRAGGEQC